MKHLQPGEPKTSSISARELWNATDVEVEAGEEYSLSAAGEWLDDRIPTTPNGYSTAEAPSFFSRLFLSFFEKRRRLPGAKWFVLAGALGEDDRAAFVIGVGPTTWKPTGKGELKCFANDVPRAYSNNHGSVSLTIMRLR